jgi:serine/threonine-protein kinase
MHLYEKDTSSTAHYETLARIGRGGMAEVLLAATRGSGVVKLSVLKCLWPELAEDADFVEMFLDEARLCARLSHPNVVQTHDVVEHDGRLALVLEYLEGQPLSRVLTRLGGSPALTLPTRLRIIAGVLAALEYAHGLTDFDGTPLEVVHRDVSPHNVIVTYDGHVKLIDFGVAKTLAASHQTRPGAVKGKLAYLAPEAIRGERVDRRADLFSVGVMLWEILAGRRLWGRKTESVSGAWRLAAGEPAPPLPGDVDVPRALRLVTTRALALDPSARYQTARDFAAALEAVGTGTSDAHARDLGRLVRQAFAAERAQRRGLIEFHLRQAPAGSAHGVIVDYASFEISGEPSGEPAGEISSEVSRELSPPAPAAARHHEAPSPRQTPSYLPLVTSTETSRVRGERRPVLAATALASLALGIGVLLGRGAIVRPIVEPSPVTAAALAPPPPPHADPAPVAATVVELPAEPREDRSTPPREHHERRAHHTRALDLASDDVLGLDGEPLAASPGSGSTRSRHD